MIARYASFPNSSPRCHTTCLRTIPENTLYLTQTIPFTSKYLPTNRNQEINH